MKHVEIKVSKDYEEFTKMCGNRLVDLRHVNELVDSISQMGYLPIPIVVNEKKQIIDGQHRFEALKQLGLEVPYITVEGAGLVECVGLNKQSKNWTIQNYIDSYIDLGAEDYSRIKNLHCKYPDIPYTALVSVINDQYNTAGSNTKILKEGRLVLSEEKTQELYSICDYVQQFKGVQQRQGSSMMTWFFALAYCYRHPDIDNEKMLHKVRCSGTSIPQTNELQTFLTYLSQVYNFRCHSLTPIDMWYKVDSYNRKHHTKRTWEVD